jgi:hypothetical protein
MQRVDLNDVRVLLREFVKKTSRIGSFLSTYDSTGQISSIASDGTPPLVVASTTVVPGLNADTLDGHHAEDFVTTWSTVDSIVLETIDDRVANTLLQNTPAVTWTYNDAANQITPAINHAGLTGLGVDDHLQYARTDGTRNITGDQVFNEDVSILQTLTTANLRMSTGAVDGYVLRTDNEGNANWAPHLAGAHGSLTGLTGDDHPQYLLTDGSRDCTGDQTFNGNVTVDDWLEIGHFKMPIGALTGRVLGCSADGTGTWLEMINEHSGLGGLTGDDHPQYLYLYGRTGGQIAVGGLSAGENLILQSTDNVVRGKIIFGSSSAYNEANDRMGVGTTTPSYKADIVGTARVTGFIMPTGAGTGYVLQSDDAGVASWGIVPSGVTDHGTLLGLSDDDHTQYVLTDGSRHVTGDFVFDKSVVITEALSRGGTIFSTNTVNLGNAGCVVTGGYGTIGGGLSNRAGDYGTCGGGLLNEANGWASVVCGGRDNHAEGANCSVTGGQYNNASGAHATIPGGFHNTAAGDYGTAMGMHANATHNGTFVWSDSTGGVADEFSSNIPDEFAIRAHGGFRVQGSGTFSDDISVTGSIYATGIDGAEPIAGAGTRFMWIPNKYSIRAGGVSGTRWDDVFVANYSTGFGYDPFPSGTYSTVAGGSSNIASGQGTFVGGGESNKVQDAADGTICGGSGNTTYAPYSFVGGGSTNTIIGTGSLGAAIIAGYTNTIGNSSSYGFVGAGQSNYLIGDKSAIIGGYSNTIGWQTGTSLMSSQRCFIGAGKNNSILGTTASPEDSVIVGGDHNSIIFSSSFIGGGSYNVVNSWESSIVGGSGNQMLPTNFWQTQYSFIGGGVSNTITDDCCTVGGGESIVCSGTHSFVGGGISNQTSESYCFVGGGSNNVASGSYAAIPGGLYNAASGSYAFAAGRKAHALHNGTFVWADNTDADFESIRTNEFAIRSGGGLRVTSSGIFNNGVWATGDSQFEDIRVVGNFTILPDVASSGYILVADDNLGTTAWMQQKIEVPISAASLKGCTTSPAGDGAGLPEMLEATASGVCYDYMKFATGSNKRAYFQLSLPSGWDRGPLTYRTKWTAAAGGAGDTVTWALEGMAISDNEALGVMYGAPVQVTDTQQNTDRVHITPESAPLTIGGSPAQGDACFFRISREDDADTSAQDIRLLELILTFTRARPTDA